MRTWGLAIAGLALAVGFQAVRSQDKPAKPPADLATTFGAREYIQQVSLSPDGSKIAMLVPARHRGLALVIGDTTKGMTLKAILASTGDGDQLAGCHWSTDTRLICQIALTNGGGKSIVHYNRIVAINADGSDINDAGRWLVKSGIADPKKLAIVGWSYGGYAALQSSVLDPDLFKAIVAVAPVTDLDAVRDTYTFPQVDAMIGHGPWVTEGSPARNADKIKAPVLLFHGDKDTNVGIGESRLMVDKIKGAGGKAELVEFKGLDHQLDDDTARATLLGRADAFLRASMGM